MKLPVRKRLFLILFPVLLILVISLAYISSVKAQTTNNYLYLNGNVGIGTANPSTANGSVGKLLNIETSGASGALNAALVGSQASSGAGGSPLVLEGKVDNVTSGDSRVGQIQLINDNGSTTALSGDMNFLTNNGGSLNEKMRITAAGNVGIGTTNPISELHIKQKAASQYQNGITLENPAGQRGAILMGGDQRLYLFDSSGYMTINTSGYVTSTGGYGAESSKTIKENFVSVDDQSILVKIDQLPIMEWNYKSQSPSLKHINTFAEDFYSAFGLNGTDNKTINLTDETGITLAGVQALSAQVNAQQKEIEELKAEIAQLKNSH